MSCSQSFCRIQLVKAPPIALAPRLESPAADELGWRWQLVMPAWLVSLLLHALLIFVLGYVASQELHGTNAPPLAELLASTSASADESDLFDDEGGPTVEVASEPTTEEQSDDAAPAGGAMSDVIAEEAPVDTSSALLSQTELAGMGQAESRLTTGAGNMTGGHKRATSLAGGKARTSVYGIEGEGNKFVYVFDRSASMGDGSASPLASAKRELLRSLDNLSDTNQFQIIFYNDKPSQMNIGRQYGGMVFADAQGKEMARRYLGSIMASGATRHAEALEMAIRLAPDVIFYLTDADEPVMNAERLLKLKRLNGGRTSIHTIEFGLGARSGGENFLAKIARQNGGKYLY